MKAGTGKQKSEQAEGNARYPVASWASRWCWRADVGLDVEVEETGTHL